MNKQKDLVTVNTNVNITVDTLQAIVRNAKEITGSDSKGVFRVDTAEMVNIMISNFLFEKDFESYAQDISNYKKK